jgi:hypothetical protein
LDLDVSFGGRELVSRRLSGFFLLARGCRNRQLVIASLLRIPISLTTTSTLRVCLLALGIPLGSVGVSLRLLRLFFQFLSIVLCHFFVTSRHFGTKGFHGRHGIAEQLIMKILAAGPGTRLRIGRLGWSVCRMLGKTRLVLLRVGRLVSLYLCAELLALFQRCRKGGRKRQHLRKALSC